MNIMLNGESKVFEVENLNVSELLRRMNVQMPEMVSVELNGEFLEREQYPSTRVSDGDKVEFLYFMGGGSHFFRRMLNWINIH